MRRSVGFTIGAGDSNKLRALVTANGRRTISPCGYYISSTPGDTMRVLRPGKNVKKHKQLLFSLFTFLIGATLRRCF